MVGKVSFLIGMFIIVVLAMTVQANPLIGKAFSRFCFWSETEIWHFFFIDLDSAGEMDFLGVCLRNCALCKKMYGSYFEGQMCADACVKFKGKIIPGK